MDKLPTEAVNAFISALEAIPASNFPLSPLKIVVELGSDQSVLDAVKILHENGILSAPVVESSAEAKKDVSWKDKYVGMADFSTICDWALTLAKDGAISTETLGSTKVSAVTNYEQWGPFLPIRLDDSMLTVLLLLSKFGVRSIPILAQDGQALVNVITQSAVVRGLAGCYGLDWFDFIAEMSLREIGLPLMLPHEVEAADESSLLLDAFAAMQKRQVGGLPVVSGPQRQVVANISARDIQALLLAPHLFHKNVTVGEYIDILASNGTAMKPAVTCTVLDSLSSVIDRLAGSHIHRIHVVDSEECLVGVVTLKDIISCFVKEPDDYLAGYISSTLLK